MKQSKIKEPLPRLYFLSRGYRKHPRLNLWAREGEAQFLSAYGTPLKHAHSPYERAKHTKRGYIAPSMPNFHRRKCHILMGEIFYGERPVYFDKHGKPYFGICHHLIEDVLDYRPENLLCWLTREEHTEADRRRRMLESMVPNGDLHVFDMVQLRELQDPRETPNDRFDHIVRIMNNQVLIRFNENNVAGDVYAGE